MDCNCSYEICFHNFLQEVKATPSVQPTPESASANFAPSGNSIRVSAAGLSVVYTSRGALTVCSPCPRGSILTAAWVRGYHNDPEFYGIKDFTKFPVHRQRLSLIPQAVKVLCRMPRVRGPFRCVLDPVEPLIVQPLQVVDRDLIPCECVHGDELAIIGEVRGVGGWTGYDTRTVLSSFVVRSLVQLHHILFSD
jgi:hypothetical protein